MSCGKSFTQRDVRKWLDEHRGPHTYGKVAEGLGCNASHSMAVGSAMRGLHNAGLHQYCPRVVKAATGMPGFQCNIDSMKTQGMGRRGATGIKVAGADAD